MNGLGGEGSRLWDEEDGFYYDFVRRADGTRTPVKLRSLVGLLPIFPAVALTESTRQRLSEQAPYFTERMRWYGERHPELASLFPERVHPGGERRRVFTLVPEDRLRRVLARMFDPHEFLSDYGIRSLSRYYLDHPFELRTRDQVLTVTYEPAESSTGMFGGNSNWRGPIWMPANLTLIAGLRNLHRCFGDDFLVEYPTGSGQHLSLDRIADDISRRLISIFLRGPDDRRPVFGWTEVMQTDPHWRDNILFYEYFHGDNGAGIGASHQTGWTAIVANLIDRLAEDAPLGSTVTAAEAR
jgi:hypothetical protein